MHLMTFLWRLFNYSNMLNCMYDVQCTIYPTWPHPLLPPSMYIAHIWREKGDQVILDTLYAKQNGLLESSHRNILYWRYCIQGRMARLQGESMCEEGNYCSPCKSITPSCVLWVYCCTQYMFDVFYYACDVFCVLRHEGRNDPRENAFLR